MKVRLFLTCWIVFSLHFATNVVREHYPAFTLIDQGDFVCDRYAGFHSDIFKHTDGHWYIGNNVMGSVIAAVPLALFDPLLDHLEERSRAGLEDRAPEEDYETRYPNRAKFFRLVRRQGLDLRFGASTAITSAFLMAPLAALMVVFLFGVLVRRNAIIMFLCIELQLNAVNLSLVAFSRMWGIDGQIFVFFVMTVAAAEAAVGLAIIISIFRHYETVNVDSFNLLKW